MAYLPGFSGTVESEKLASGKPDYPFDNRRFQRPSTENILVCLDK
jgi:hypothetical protein